MFQSVPCSVIRTDLDEKSWWNILECAWSLIRTDLDEGSLWKLLEGADLDGEFEIVCVYILDNFGGIRASLFSLFPSLLYSLPCLSRWVIMFSVPLFCYFLCSYFIFYVFVLLLMFCAAFLLFFMFLFYFVCFYFILYVFIFAFLCLFS